MSRLRSLEQRLRPSWDTLGLALFVCASLVASLPLGRVAAWIPQTVLAITLVLIVVKLAADIRTRPASAARADHDARDARETSPLLAALWIVGLLLSLWLLGLVAGTTLFGLAFLRGFARESWRISLLFALSLGVGVQVIFGVLLRATLYQGWLLS